MKTTPSQENILQWVDELIFNVTPDTPPGSPKKQERGTFQALESDLFEVLNSSSDSSRPRSTSALPPASQSHSSEAQPVSAVIPQPLATTTPFFPDSVCESSDQKVTTEHQQNAHSSDTDEVREAPFNLHARPDIKKTRDLRSSRRSHLLQRAARDYLKEHFCMDSLTKDFAKEAIPEDSTPAMNNRIASRNCSAKHVHAIKAALARIQATPAFAITFDATKSELKTLPKSAVTGINKLFVTAIMAFKIGGLLNKGEKISASHTDVGMLGAAEAPPR
jgi:hypothetical protein